MKKTKKEKGTSETHYFKGTRDLDAPKVKGQLWSTSA